MTNAKLMKRMVTVATCVALVGACNNLRGESSTVTAVMIGDHGNEIGTVVLEPIEDGVLMRVDARDLSPGEHAMHVHEMGVCEPPKFETAGAHFNPSGGQHGLADRDEGAVHAGDLENIVVDDSGRVITHRVIRDVTLEKNAARGATSLLQEGGTAVVIHAKPDDNTTDPSGASGDRIACAVIAGS